MAETFSFPQYGSPTEVASVQIKPQWQAKQLEDSLRLIGIYHITAHVRFDFKEPLESMDSNQCIVIDALDLQGDTGYFEYAVPLHIDLPKDASIEDLFVNSVQTSLNNHECSLQWEICSMYQQPEVKSKQNESSFVKQEKERKLAVESSSEERIPVAIAFESSSHQLAQMPSSSMQIVQEMATEIHDDVPMIWDLKENYSLLIVRASKDVIR